MKTFEFMIGICLISLLTSSCDSSDCDFEVDSLCVVIDTQESLDIGSHIELAKTIHTALVSLNVRTQEHMPKFNLFDFLDTMLENDRQVVVSYIDKERIGNARGLTVGHMIRIVAYDSSDKFACFEHSYVLQHELLHVIVTYELGVSSETNKSHDVENFFIEWAFEHDKLVSDTIEFDIFWDSHESCGTLDEWLAAQE